MNGGCCTTADGAGAGVTEIVVVLAVKYETT